MSGMTNATLLPLWANVGMPMGLRMLSRVVAYSVSQVCSIHDGSATVCPGMNTSVLSGNSALISPCPYSNSNFIVHNSSFSFES